MGSIPIARSINPVDAVGLTGFWVRKSAYLSQLLDANGRDYPSIFSIGREAFAQAHPEEAHSIEKTLKFRLGVASEFERLVCEGVPVAELPDVEEPELSSDEETASRFLAHVTW